LSKSEDILYLIWKALSRNNPIATDEPFFKPFKLTIAPGEKATFRYDAPKDRVIFLRSIGFDDPFTSNTGQFRLSVDGKQLSIDMVDRKINDYWLPVEIFEPPKRARFNVQLEIKNNDTSTRTVKGFIKGWLRWK